MSGPLIALTGATGFIGRNLLGDLQRRGYRVRILLRRPNELPTEANSAVVGDLMNKNLSAALRDVDAVIHSAGLAETMSGRPEDDFRAINTDATVALARAASRIGVRRFVFMSSVRAQSGPFSEEVLTEEAPPRPTDAYGRSKLAAEQGIAELGIDWAALRPVLVYGPGAEGNVASLVALARSPLPLPLGAFTARRSLLSVANLADAIDTVLKAPAPLGRPLLVADDGALTVAEIIGALRKGLGRRPGIVPIPKAIVSAVLAATGRKHLYERLAMPLLVDASALRSLGWEPKVATRDGLASLAGRGAAPE